MEDTVTPLRRDEAIRKVAAFLRANYPCDCAPGDPDCDDLDSLDEAATIVEMVEASFFPTWNQRVADGDI